MEDKISVCIKTTEVDGEEVPLRDSVPFEEGTLTPGEVMLVGRAQGLLMARRGVVTVLEEAQQPAEHPAKKTTKKKVSKKAPTAPGFLE